MHVVSLTIYLTFRILIFSIYFRILKEKELDEIKEKKSWDLRCPVCQEDKEVGNADIAIAVEVSWTVITVVAGSPCAKEQ